MNKNNKMREAQRQLRRDFEWEIIHINGVVFEDPHEHWRQRRRQGPTRLFVTCIYMLLSALDEKADKQRKARPNSWQRACARKWQAPRHFSGTTDTTRESNKQSEWQQPQSHHQDLGLPRGCKRQGHTKTEQGRSSQNTTKVGHGHGHATLIHPTHLLSAPDFGLGSESDPERCAHLEALLGLLPEVVVQLPERTISSRVGAIGVRRA